MRPILSSFFVVLLLVVEPASAQEAIDKQVDSLSEQVEALTELLESLQGVVDRQQDRIEALEEENADLLGEGESEVVEEFSPPDSPEGVPTATEPRISQSLNPDIGVVVDLVGSFTESGEDEEGNDRLSVREMELTIGHDIDPYARFDSTITLSDFEEVTVEEAYVTFWGLPWELQARAGRMRPKVGKATALHRDELDTVDEPLVVQRYLGIEGLFLTGVEVSRFLPQFIEPLSQELTLGVMEGGIGEDGSLFGETRRHPTYFGHLKNSWDFSPATNLELGGTYLLGSSDEDNREDVQALGVDLSLRRNFASSRALKWQSELYAQDRDDAAINKSPWGYYSLVDYRFASRWGLGGRYDWVELVNPDPADSDDKDKAYSAFVTFYQSEFARLRVQYQHADLATGERDNRFFFQGTFAVGVHKHKIQ